MKRVVLFASLFVSVWAFAGASSPKWESVDRSQNKREIFSALILAAQDSTYSCNLYQRFEGESGDPASIKLTDGEEFAFKYQSSEKGDFNIAGTDHSFPIWGYDYAWNYTVNFLKGAEYTTLRIVMGSKMPHPSFELTAFIYENNLVKYLEISFRKNALRNKGSVAEPDLKVEELNYTYLCSLK